MLKIGVLCSGHLGQKTLTHLVANRAIKFVLTDRQSTAIRKFCREQSIPVFAGNPRGGEGYQFVREHPVDVIASINYLFLIEQDIIDHPAKLAFNIHGSLLPKYRGRTPHVWAIINNEKQTGITAHEIEVGCDTGPIIHQMTVDLDDNDTGASVLKEFEQLYCPLVDQVLQQVELDQIVRRPQDESQATCCGKRTPQDGEINWDWCRERIRNWVRAQAAPYPGAFTWHDDQKVIIDRVSFSEHGFDASLPNGTLLETLPKPIVKTTNGALSLDEIRDPIQLAENARLGDGMSGSN